MEGRSDLERRVEELTNEVTALKALLLQTISVLGDYDRQILLQIIDGIPPVLPPEVSPLETPFASRYFAAVDILNNYLTDEMGSFVNPPVDHGDSPKGG